VGAFFVLGNTEGTQAQLFFTFAENFSDRIYPTGKVYKQEEDCHYAEEKRRHKANLLIPLAHRCKSSDGLSG